MAAMEGGEDKKEGGDGGAEDDDDDLVYGAPDDHAWTDKSHAHKEAEENSKDGPDMSVSCFGYAYPCVLLPDNAFCLSGAIYLLLHCLTTFLHTYMASPVANLRQGRQKAQ